MEIAIIPYAEAHFDAVTCLWLDSWRSTGLAAAAAASEDFLRERLRGEIARGWLIFVAIAVSDAVGFLALHDNKLEQLFIAPSMQGRGIGRQLLDFAKDRLPQGLWLTAAVENAGARRFYEREGLTPGGVSVHQRLGHGIIRYVGGRLPASCEGDRRWVVWRRHKDTKTGRAGRQWRFRSTMRV